MLNSQKVVVCERSPHVVTKVFTSFAVESGFLLTEQAADILEVYHREFKLIIDQNP